MNELADRSGRPRGERLEKEHRELAILHRIAAALNESVDLASSLDAALSRVAELLELRSGWVWLLEEETEEPYLAASRNLPPGLGNRPETMEGSCYCLDTFRSGGMEGAANVNVVVCSRLRGLTKGTDGLGHHASIPLRARGRPLGVMNVASQGWRRLSSDELQLLHTIGEMVGTAIERANLFRKSTEAGATEERNRLAREIHDTLAQGLAATALHLDAAEALLESGTDPEAARALVRRALEGTRRNLEDARRSVLDLRAAPLEGRTLSEALQGKVAQLRERYEPELVFHSVGAAQPLSTSIETALFRVAEEALSNALQHAGASRIALRLTAAPDRVMLEVVDDGRGFGVRPEEGRGFGLTGMRERLRLLGGDLQVRSAPGAGASVRATVPLATND